MGLSQKTKAKEATYRNPALPTDPTSLSAQPICLAGFTFFLLHRFFENGFRTFSQTFQRSSSTTRECWTTKTVN